MAVYTRYVLSIYKKHVVTQVPKSGVAEPTRIAGTSYNGHEQDVDGQARKSGKLQSRTVPECACACHGELCDLQMYLKVPIATCELLNALSSCCASDKAVTTGCAHSLGTNSTHCLTIAETFCIKCKTVSHQSPSATLPEDLAHPRTCISASPVEAAS